MTPPTTQPTTAPETNGLGAVRFPDEIRAWTAANTRARREYQEHPLMRSCNGPHRCTYRYLKRAGRVA